MTTLAKKLQKAVSDIPQPFYFVVVDSNEYVLYNAAYNYASGMVEVLYKVDEGTGWQGGGSMTPEDARAMIKSGDWRVLAKKEADDYFVEPTDCIWPDGACGEPTCEVCEDYRNLDDDCDVEDCPLCSEGGETVLEDIKMFTQLTGASVFISDGKFELFYGDFDHPAHAECDIHMSELMDAVTLLHHASFQQPSSSF